MKHLAIKHLAMKHLPVFLGPLSVLSETSGNIVLKVVTIKHQQNQPLRMCNTLYDCSAYSTRLISLKKVGVISAANCCPVWGKLWPLGDSTTPHTPTHTAHNTHTILNEIRQVGCVLNQNKMITTQNISGSI